MTAVGVRYIGLGVGLGLLVGCASELGSDTTGSSVDALGEAAPLPDEVGERLEHCDHLSDAELDHVYSLDHFVRIDSTRRVHVNEKFTLRSWMRWPHRAMVMLPGTIAVGDFYDLDLDGYRFQDTVAQRGFFAFTVDYEGSGQSTSPTNGYDVTHSFLVAENRPVVAFVRRLRMVSRVDVLGESNGGAVASELCDDRHSVRSCVMSSMIYKDPTPFFSAAFLDPGLIFFLTHQPNGYLDVPPAFYFNIVATMNDEVRAATLATQPGVYAVGPLIAPINGLPWYDPTRAAVPGLLIQGTEDISATQHDADLLAADYGRVGGGHATLVRIDGAGLIPRAEPAPVNQQWTQIVLDFVDPPHHNGDHDDD